MSRLTLSSAYLHLKARTIAGLAIALTLTTRESASADPGLEPAERAIELGKQGLDHYARGECAEALLAFERADELAHSPVFGLYMARCKRQASKLIEARRLYERVASETVEADAPAPWTRAVADANAELRALLPSIPSICVAQGTSQIEHVSIENRAISATVSCTEVELDPGQHRVTVWDRAGHRSDEMIELREGQRRVPLEIHALPAGTERPRVPEPQAERAPSPKEHGSGSLKKTIGTVSLGVGIAGVTLGTVAAIVAANKTSAIDCAESGCPPERASEVHSATQWANLATAGFIFGGAAAAGGIIALWVVPNPSPQAPLMAGVSGSF